MSTPNTRRELTDDDVDTVSKALRRAYQLGQTYWQQADSESYIQNKKSDETQVRFDALVDDTRAMLAAIVAHEALNADAGVMRAPEGWKLVPVEPSKDMLYEAQEYSDILPPRGKRLWAQMLAAAPSIDLNLTTNVCASSAAKLPVSRV